MDIFRGLFLRNSCSAKSVLEGLTPTSKFLFSVYKQNNLRMLPQIILKKRLTVRFRRMNSSGIRRKQKSQMSEKICGDVSAGTVAGDIDTSREVRDVREVYRRDSCARTLAPCSSVNLTASPQAN